MIALTQIESRFKKYCRTHCKDKRNDAILKLSGFSRKVIIKIDELYDDTRMVDFFVFADNTDNLIIVILEIKGKNFSESEVKGKFDFGTPLCEDIKKQYLCNIAISGFFPIFLVPSVNSRFEWDNLKSFKVRFNGKIYDLIRETGRIELSEVIRLWSP